MAIRYTPFQDRAAVDEAVRSSKSTRQAIIALGVNYSTQAAVVFKAACRQHDIELSFPDPYANKKALDDTQVFVKNSTYTNNRSKLLDRLIRLGFVLECAICGLGPEWNQLPLRLQVDHINGVANDHRLENLRILCPNCHTQTATYAGRRATETAEAICQYRKCDNTYEHVIGHQARSRQKYCSVPCANKERAAKLQDRNG